MVHTGVFRAPPQACYQAARSVNLFRAPVIRTLTRGFCGVDMSLRSVSVRAADLQKAAATRRFALGRGVDSASGNYVSTAQLKGHVRNVVDTPQRTADNEALCAVATTQNKTLRDEQRGAGESSRTCRPAAVAPDPCLHRVLLHATRTHAGSRYTLS